MQCHPFLLDIHLCTQRTVRRAKGCKPVEGTWSCGNTNLRPFLAMQFAIVSCGHLSVTLSLAWYFSPSFLVVNGDLGDIYFIHPLVSAVRTLKPVFLIFTVRDPAVSHVRTKDGMLSDETPFAPCNSEMHLEIKALSSKILVRALVNTLIQVPLNPFAIFRTGGTLTTAVASNTGS